MPNFEIRVTKRPNIETPKFTDAQMRELGDEAISAIKDRNAAGIDVFDAKSKPLSERYARRKLRQGKQGIRDLRLSGNLLGSVQVVEAASDHVKVTIKGSTPFRKGLFNQNIDPWFGLSDDDQSSRVLPLAQRIFGDNVRHMADIGQ